MKNRQLVNISIALLCLIAIGLGAGFYAARYYDMNTVPAIPGLLWPDPKQLEDFNTIDHTDHDFGLKALQGKWSFIFFGYTHCPDICPITLSVLNQVYGQLQNEEKNDTRIIFVTVDPERDNTRQLAEYVSYFNTEFIGLGGSEEQIQTLTTQLGIPYFHGEKSATGDYNVDHSASIFLLDPEVRLVALFSTPHIPELILSRFRDIRTFINKRL